MNPMVAIVILNWNGWEDTIECLESIYQINYDRYVVIVVDNGSTDGSIDKIKEYCSGNKKVDSNYVRFSHNNKPIRVFDFPFGSDTVFNDKNSFVLIANEINHGFTGGNNIGMRFALDYIQPDYILLLNNDVAVHIDFLAEMIKVGESRKDVGGMSSVVYEYDSPDTVQQGGEIMQWFRTTSIKLWNPHLNEDVITCQIPSGACILTKTSVIKIVGYLSSDFPFLSADIDFYLRIIKAGYINAVVKKSIIWHKISRSVNKVPYTLVQEKIKDRLLLRYKHLPLGTFFLYLFFIYPYHVFLILAASIIKYPSIKTLLVVARGLLFSFKSLIKIMTRREGIYVE